jgi:hypothetical protein
MKEMAKKESKRAADKKRKREFAVTNPSWDTERWKAEGKKEMLTAKLEAVEDLMSHHTCEKLQLKLMVGDFEER